MAKWDRISIHLYHWWVTWKYLSSDSVWFARRAFPTLFAVDSGGQPVTEIDFQTVLGVASSLTVKRDGKFFARYRDFSRQEQGNTDGVKTWYHFVIRPEMWVMTLSKTAAFSKIWRCRTFSKRYWMNPTSNDKQFYPEEHLKWVHHSKRETMYEFWCRLVAEEG